MKTNILVLFALIFLLFFDRCNNSTEPVNIDGRISGKISIGEYNRKPKNILLLKLYKDNGNLQLIDSVFTESGRYKFEGLRTAYTLYVLHKTITTHHLEIGNQETDYVKLMKSDILVI